MENCNLRENMSERAEVYVKIVEAISKVNVYYYSRPQGLTKPYVIMVVKPG